MNIEVKHLEELSKAFSNLGARHELLTIIDSWGDLLTDEEVYQQLKEWNENFGKVHVPKMYTGHKDKNGKDIFTGDKWRFLNVEYTVVEEEGEYYFEHPDKRSTFDDWIEMKYSKEGVLSLNK